MSHTGIRNNSPLIGECDIYILVEPVFTVMFGNYISHPLTVIKDRQGTHCLNINIALI